MSKDDSQIAEVVQTKDGNSAKPTESEIDIFDFREIRFSSVRS